MMWISRKIQSITHSCSMMWIQKWRNISSKFMREDLKTTISHFSESKFLTRTTFCHQSFAFLMESLTASASHLACVMLLVELGSTHRRRSTRSRRCVSFYFSRRQWRIGDCKLNRNQYLYRVRSWKLHRSSSRIKSSTSTTMCWGDYQSKRQLTSQQRTGSWSTRTHHKVPEKEATTQMLIKCTALSSRLVLSWKSK